MPRSVNHVASRRRRRKILELAKGYWGARKNVYTIAKHAVEKGLQYQYRDRKVRKREFRKLWIIRINAAARINGVSYSKFMAGLKKHHIDINRKVLADLAIHDKAAFAEIAKKAVA